MKRFLKKEMNYIQQYMDYKNLLILFLIMIQQKTPLIFTL